MRTFDPWRPWVALAALAFWGAGSAFAAPNPVRLAPGELAAYKGTAVLVQSVGEDVTTFDFKADALYLTRAAGDGSRDLLTARYLQAVDESGTFGSVDRYRVAGGAESLALEPAGAVVFELKPHLHMLNVYMPWETLPTFSVPEPGKESASREKVRVLNLADVEGALRTATTAEGGSLEVTRELAAGESPGFDFRGNDAKVTLYRLKYTIGRETGRVEALESDCAFEFSQGETKIRLERRVRLKEAGIAGIDSAEAPAWAGRLKDLPAMEKEFAERKSSEDIAKSIESFSQTVDETPLAALAGALRFRLQAYQQMFEATPAGRVLAGVLGHKAPDFTLKDLEGKDVNFHAATAKNKATLLSFWGYG